MSRQIDLTVQGVVGTSPVLSRASGRAFCRFRVAVTPSHREGRDWVDDPTVWFTAKAWGAQPLPVKRGPGPPGRPFLPGELVQRAWLWYQQRDQPGSRRARPLPRGVSVRAAGQWPTCRGAGRGTRRPAGAGRRRAGDGLEGTCRGLPGRGGGGDDKPCGGTHMRACSRARRRPPGAVGARGGGSQRAFRFHLGGSCA